MMQSRFVKTPLNRRKFYTYYFLDGTTRVFHVGDNGVTAEIIKKLHSYDDAEVYNNIKNASPDPPKSEKKERKEWNNKHPEDIRNRRWNISLDAPILLSDGDYAFTQNEDTVRTAMLFALGYEFYDVSQESRHNPFSQLCQKDSAKKVLCR